MYDFKKITDWIILKNDFRIDEGSNIRRWEKHQIDIDSSEIGDSIWNWKEYLVTALEQQVHSLTSIAKAKAIRENQKDI